MHNFKFKAIQNSQDRTSSYTYIFPQLTNTLSSAHSNPYKWYNPVTYSLQARIKEIGEHSRSSDYTHTQKKNPKTKQKRERQQLNSSENLSTSKFQIKTWIQDLLQTSTRFSLEFQKAFRSTGALFSFHLEWPIQPSLLDQSSQNYFGLWGRWGTPNKQKGSPTKTKLFLPH